MLEGCKGKSAPVDDGRDYEEIAKENGTIIDMLPAPCYDGATLPIQYVEDVFIRSVIDDYDETKVTPDFSKIKVEAVNTITGEKVELEKGRGFIVKDADDLYEGDIKVTDGKAIKVSFTRGEVESGFDYYESYGSFMKYGSPENFIGTKSSVDVMSKLINNHLKSIHIPDDTEYLTDVVDLKKFIFRISYPAKVNDNVVGNGETVEIVNKVPGTRTNNFTSVTTKLGKLHANKVDAKTNTPLAGAEFELRECAIGKDEVLPNSPIIKVNGEDRFVTGDDGKIEINGVQDPAFVNGKEKVPSFEYCLKEVQAPKGYALEDAPTRVKYGTGESAVIGNDVAPTTEEEVTPTPSQSETPTSESSIPTSSTTSKTTEQTPTSETPTSESSIPTSSTTSKTTEQTPTSESSIPTSSTTSKTTEPTTASSTTRTTTTAVVTPTNTHTASNTPEVNVDSMNHGDAVPAPAKKNPQVNTGGHSEKVSAFSWFMSIFR